MKVVILAGGFGTRLSEETRFKPKPLVEIGDKPILWHIMKIYSSYGFNEFIICLGYKGNMIKEYFLNFLLQQADLTLDISEGTNSIEIHRINVEPWKITLVDTGLESMTGGRLGRVQSYVGDETFMLTYGDGVSNVNILDLVQFHKEHGKPATLTAVKPEGRFGSIVINNENTIDSFVEKPQGDGKWINGGFFVLEPSVFSYINGDQSIFETDVLPELAKNNQLKAFKHNGFWKPMDSLNDRNQLEKIWNDRKPPWKVWQAND